MGTRNFRKLMLFCWLILWNIGESQPQKNASNAQILWKIFLHLSNTSSEIKQSAFFPRQQEPKFEVERMINESNLTGTTRELFATAPLTCEVTPDELAGLTNAVVAAHHELISSLANPLSTFTSSNSQTALKLDVPANECAQSIVDAKTMLQNIVQEIKRLKTAGNVDSGAYEAALKRIEEKDIEFKKQIDRIESSARQANDLKTFTLTTVVQKLQSQILNITRQLHHEMDARREETTLLIISELKRGKLNDNNINKFLQLGNKTFEMFNRLVNDVFLKETVTVSSNLLHFCEKMPYYADDARCLPALYDAIRRLNYLSNVIVVDFGAYVRSLTESSKFFLMNKAIQSNLTSLQKHLNEAENVIYSSWASDIRYGNYPLVLENYASRMTLISPFLRIVIERAYGSIRTRVDQIIRSIQLSKTWNLHIHLLHHLVNIMCTNKDIYSNEGVLLMKEVLSVWNRRHDMRSDQQDYIKNTMSLIPSNLKFFLGQEAECKIRNRWGNYMYAGSKKSEYNSDRRNLFVTGFDDFQIAKRWYITPVGKKYEFVIRNKYYGEYLYAASSFHDTFYHGRVFTWQPDEPVTDEFWTFDLGANDGSMRVNYVPRQATLVEYQFEIFSWLKTGDVSGADWMFECD